MQLDYAFLADMAQVSSGKLYVIGGDIDRIWAGNFPCAPRLALIMKYMLESGELDRLHAFTVTVMDADGKKIFEVEEQHKVNRNPLNESWRHQGFLMQSEFLGALRFDRAGDYSFEILVDGSHVKSLPLHVIPRVEEPTAA